MKERIQNRINSIKQMATAPKGVVKAYNEGIVARPDNALSRSIRNEKDASQFKAELKAAIELGKLR